MRDSHEMSPGESTAWQIAYDSNVAYDALQTVREMNGRQVEVAEREFEILKTMAHAIASAEHSPFHVDYLRPDDEPTTADKPKPARPKERRAPRMLVNDVLVDMLDRGEVAPNDGTKPTAVLQERVGFDNYDWAKARAALGRYKVLVFEEDRIAVNEETLAEMEQEGRLSEEVQEALIRHRTGNQYMPEPAPEPSQPPAIEIEPEPVPDNNNGQGEVEEVGEVDEGIEEEEAESPDPIPDTPEEPELPDLPVEDTIGADEPIEPPAPQPKQRRRSVQKAKIFSFNFESQDGRTFARQLQPSAIAKLSSSVKLLLGVGQARDRSYSFYSSEEQRLAFVLKVVNKGLLDENKHLDETGLQTLIKEALAAGHLGQDDEGLYLTRLGFDTIITTKLGKKSYLGQVGLRETASTSTG